MSTKTPHVHAAVIKAWADGETIQYRTSSLRTWIDLDSSYGTPMWAHEWQYRVKPEPKPDIVVFHHFYANGAGRCYIDHSAKSNLRLIFDGETKQLKSAEVINE